ncbi:hypothetical protein SK128_013902 [Halocaridina rubra]|uniref:Uncharacterized protein n=1 Tax=Halocaridina rubra TaxID=373956 RepID=A0AAN8WDE4_HALRR
MQISAHLLVWILKITKNSLHNTIWFEEPENTVSRGAWAAIEGTKAITVPAGPQSCVVDSVAYFGYDKEPVSQPWCGVWTVLRSEV